jgi:hypothetical protein
MREAVTAPRLRVFMRALAAEAREPGRIYLTGGASAALQGWRDDAIDVDCVIPSREDGEESRARSLAALGMTREKLHINVELASPADFVPPLRGWEERSPFIAQEGPLAFHHFDFYTQALAKLERGHRKDLDDVGAMVRDGLVDPKRLVELFDEVEPSLYRYPAVDPNSLRAAVTQLASR